MAAGIFYKWSHFPTARLSNSRVEPQLPLTEYFLIHPHPRAATVLKQTPANSSLETNAVFGLVSRWERGYSRFYLRCRKPRPIPPFFAFTPTQSRRSNSCVWWEFLKNTELIGVEYIIEGIPVNWEPKPGRYVWISNFYAFALKIKVRSLLSTLIFLNPSIQPSLNWTSKCFPDCSRVFAISSIRRPFILSSCPIDLCYAPFYL